MKCLVIGATGFVGGHLCERLVTEGHEVFALARKKSNTKVLKRIGAKIIPGDLEAVNVFARYAQEIDVVFHLAAITKTPKADNFYHVNTDGTECVLRGLTRGAFQGRIVYLSSLAAGGPSPDPKHLRREEDPDMPVSDYGKSKLAAEQVIERLLPEGCTYTVLRPGAIYGPREHEIYEVLKVVQRFGFSVKFGDGVNCQLIHVADVVEGLVRAAFSPEASNRTYFLCDGPAYSFDEIIKMAGESLGKKVRILRLPMGVGAVLAKMLDLIGRVWGKCISPLTADKILEMEAGTWACDSSRIQAELGWTSQYDFPRGMQETIEWYRKEKWLS